ncbi:hypothetical protein [Exiguobacterium sp. s192]|uniref:hypothetical protein n=1 Tax=Exiguobacterium sp. s192 TaxID=2751206 RepID=UPI001BEC25C0|nr:hypothetical protein [Exiguobacterium sp. s192]
MPITTRIVSLITMSSILLLLLWTTEIISPTLFVLGFIPLSLAMLFIGLFELKQVLTS